MNGPENTLVELEILEHTAEIVAAYVGNNAISPADIARLIADTHTALVLLQKGEVVKPVVELIPAVSIKKSITSDFLICLEDGKSFKSLKRHLSTHYNLTPQQYREKWGLPPDYPMTAPSYSATRSALAKSAGLGRKPQVPAAENKPITAKRKTLGLKF